MGLIESFRDSAKLNFGSSGIIFPPTTVTNLGDYGFYKQGNFHVVDNIFKKTKTSVNDFINDRLEESPAFNIILNNKEATSVLTEIKGEFEQIAGVEIAFSLNSSSGFVAQLTNLQTESIFLNDELERLLKSLKDDGLWKNSYKFVWQLWRTELKFAFAQTKESKIVLSAAVNKAITEIANLNLNFNYAKSSGTSGNLWAKEGVLSTPIANFARYNIFGTAKPEFKSKIFERDAEPFVKDVIIPDNSWD